LEYNDCGIGYKVSMHTTKLCPPGSFKIVGMLKPTSGVHLSNLLHSMIQEVDGCILLPTFHSLLKLNSIAAEECLV